MFSLVSEIWNFAKLNLETLGHHTWMAYLKTCIVCIMLLCSVVLEWVACPRCSENIKNVEWCIVWILSTYLFWTWLKHQLLATVCSCLAPAAAGQKWNCRLQIVCINNLIVCFLANISWWNQSHALWNWKLWSRWFLSVIILIFFKHHTWLRSAMNKLQVL